VKFGYCGSYRLHFAVGVGVRFDVAVYSVIERVGWSFVSVCWQWASRLIWCVMGAFMFGVWNWGCLCAVSRRGGMRGAWRCDAELRGLVECFYLF